MHLFSNKMLTACWMDLPNIQNERKGNYDGPLESVCTQPPGLPLPIMVTTQYTINGVTRGNSTKLHEENHLNVTYQLQGNTELKFFSLVGRQERYAMTYIWKILESQTLVLKITQTAERGATAWC